MRIEGTPPLRTATTRRDDRGGDRSFANAVDSDTAAPVSTTASVVPVAGLFALQEVSDALTGRRRTVARGMALLDQLDELRLALLAGLVPRERLRGLLQVLRERLPLAVDPALSELIADIELRCMVELAKLGEPV